MGIPISINIKRDVLRRDGTAVDAAVAGLFCQTVHHSYSCGLGGGLFMTIYLAETREAIVMNARETAPSYAHEDMYAGMEFGSQFGRQ